MLNQTAIVIPLNPHDFPVDTRAFYACLERTTPYSQWMSKAIIRLGLQEYRDFIAHTQMPEGRGRPTTTFLVTKNAFMRILQDVVKTKG